MHLHFCVTLRVCVNPEVITLAFGTAFPTTTTSFIIVIFIIFVHALNETVATLDRQPLIL
eukprot:m.351535 g.351535  ORF g.351535 m.351535 type:complete len:60 (+) comp16270_c0_seq1:3380-3559(+)